MKFFADYSIIMDNYLRYIFVICLLGIYCNFVLAQECTPGGFRKFDATIAKLMTIGNSGRKFPENKGQDLKNYCDQSANYITELDNYKTKCMKDMSKQVAGVLIYALKNTVKQLCRKDSQRLTQMIAASSCANTGNAEITNCYSKYIDMLLGSQHAEQRLKIPIVCCEFPKLFACIANRLKRVNKCTETHINAIVDFAKSIAANAVDVLCGDYSDGSDKCDGLGPPPKKKKNQRRSKSFALPFFQLLESIPEA